MSEPRKNHLSIEGAQLADEEHVASYKPIPETDGDFRTSKNSIGKSKEKISPDGAEEKLLPKEEEAKIVTRVDMADAKYIVEDHRNGDAKIELDANKRQFSGLSKEELMKYADDPFWVNLRWFMFIAFWAMWLCMLGGAITIIIKAPKCDPPTPRTWYEKGPLVDMGESTYDDILPELPHLQRSLVQGIFVDAPVYEPDSAMDTFKSFVTKAKEFGVKVIVDVIPNYVSVDHEFFLQSVKKVFPYENYFVWADGKDHDEEGRQKPPNSWVSTLNTSAWTFNEERGQFYLHQYGTNQPDLNFNNEAVVKEFDKVIRKYMSAGAAGIRLVLARQLLVNSSLAEETAAVGRGALPGADHLHYSYWRHAHTSDLPLLDTLFARWADLVATTAQVPDENVFTLAEDGSRAELFLLARNLTSLRPLSAAPLSLSHNVSAAAADINKRLGHWPAIQLVSDDAEVELASFSLLLPAAPVFNLRQVEPEGNDTTTTESLSHLVSLRDDASVEHGYYVVAPVPAQNDTGYALIACARWKAGHTGYVAVFNPTEEEHRANLTSLTSLPHSLTVHHMSHTVKLYTNYTNNYSELSDNVLVPPKSSIVMSYVPKTVAEN